MQIDLKKNIAYFMIHKINYINYFSRIRCVMFSTKDYAIYTYMYILYYSYIYYICY